MRYFSEKRTVGSIQRLSFILCILYVSLTTAAKAEAPPLQHPAVCDDDAPERCVQPLELGERAPWPGQLLSTAKAIQLGQAAEHSSEWCQLELTRTSSLAALELDHARALGRIDLAAALREKELYRGLYEVERSRAAWYEHPAFVVPTTVLGTLAGVWLATRVVELGSR